MVKAIATFFLVMLVVFTGFFTFSYFATAEVKRLEMFPSRFTLVNNSSAS